MENTPTNATPDYPARKRPTHLASFERHNEPVILFVTVCTAKRRDILAQRLVHDALVDAWGKCMYWRVGKYMIMPDHIHLFCSPGKWPFTPVALWVRQWKRLSSIALPSLCPIWQRDCWDTQLRHADHYSQKWEYVAMNPVRKGFVERPGDWPHQGELNTFIW